MIYLEAHDSSFFEIKSDKLDVDFRVLSDDIVNFEYTEEMGKASSGSITLYDPNHIYSKILRFGMPIKIRFGYTRPDAGLFGSFLVKKNPTELINFWERRGITGYIQSPSGGGTSAGEITYNCNFYTTEWASPDKKQKMYKEGTKGDVIAQVFIEMGINNYFINFDRMNETITYDTWVIQNESNFKFLLRMAFEWKAIFRVGYDENENLVAIFTNAKYLDTNPFALLVTNAFAGSSVYFDYGGIHSERSGGIPNVVEFTWQHHVGENGMGDNVRIQYVNGQPVFMRFTAKEEKIILWRLVPERIQAELKRRKDVKSQFQLMKEWMSVEDFEQIKWAFEPVMETTAPQGLGYSMNITTLGNPALTAPLKAMFGLGFPDFANHKGTSFWIRKATHSISRSGYRSTVDIADAWTITGGSMI